MASSEAVMVAPEQCATAPKTLVSKQAEAPAAAKTSTTRVVLLAVLALAAATGAMFGVVVFGNEFTKDMHPKGGALVDSEDRAVATAAVESYVSLLDLPLLGTAELNKVDGITFSTYKGIEHRKVTGYTVTKETAVVGDSEVATPRLSLATSAPGVTVEVSVRDNKAWLSEAAAGKVATTAIDATSQRRLADGGSCLENGACLYSRDELLHLDAASRRLEEGSFFARADVAAYQVELDGDVMPYLERSAEGAAYLDGTWTEGAHKLRLRIAETPAGTEAFFTNYTSGRSKLLTKAGTYLYTADGRLYQCHEALHAAVEAYTVDSIINSMTFESSEVSHGEAKADFIPFHPTKDECGLFNAQLGNLTSPEALEAYPQLAGAYQNKDVASKADFFSAKNRRRLAKSAQKHTQRQSNMDDIKQMVEIIKTHEQRELGGRITHYDLWVATRMADPTFVDYKGYVTKSWSDDAFKAAVDMPTDLALSLGGLYGISQKFLEASGFTYAGARRRLSGERKLKEEMPEHCMQMQLDMARMELEEGFVDPGLIMAYSQECLDPRSEDYALFKENAHSKASLQKAFYSTDIASSYMNMYSEGMLKEIDPASISCPSFSSYGDCLGKGEMFGCTWNKFFSCCSEGGMPCGGAMDVELTMQNTLGAAGSQYTLAVEKTQDFLQSIYPGSCPGGFLPTNPMMEAIAIGSVCKEVKGGIFDMMCKGTDPGTFQQMTQPNAWASTLEKGGEYVAAFQGTKLHDLTMMEYTLKRDPVYVAFGATMGTVVQEGYALYIAHLFRCMATSRFEPSYITGHSLGGAAATIYAKYKTSASLVTFGAPPTQLRALQISGLSLPTVKSGFEIKTKMPAPVPKRLPSFTCGGKSIRYFHKFDPIPSFYFAQGIWMHETAEAVLLFDEIKEECGAPKECGVSAQVDEWTGGLSSYLCTTHGVKTSAVKMGCSGMDYFSYMNAINPLPCAEVMLSYAASMYPSGHSSVTVIPWTPAEGFTSCTESYIGSISAYFGVYLASDLESLRGSAMKRDAMDVGIFYAAWGLMWIHSSYAHYCLTGSSYGSGLKAGKSPLKLFEKLAPSYVSASFEGNFDWYSYTDIKKECIPLGMALDECMTYAEKKGAAMRLEGSKLKAFKEEMCFREIRALDEMFKGECKGGILKVYGIKFDISFDEDALKAAWDAGMES